MGKVANFVYTLSYYKGKETILFGHIISFPYCIYQTLLYSNRKWGYTLMIKRKFGWIGVEVLIMSQCTWLIDTRGGIGCRNNNYNQLVIKATDEWI